MPVVWSVMNGSNFKIASAQMKVLLIPVSGDGVAKDQLQTSR